MNVNRFNSNTNDYEKCNEKLFNVLVKSNFSTILSFSFSEIILSFKKAFLIRESRNNEFENEFSRSQKHKNSIKNPI